jgi:hypothetical protein
MDPSGIADPSVSPELQGLLLPMRRGPGLDENRKQSDDQNAGENNP